MFCHQVEQEVSEEIAVWERQHGRRFLVDGVPFVDFVKRQWLDHHEHREKEKEQRVLGKTGSWEWLRSHINVWCVRAGKTSQIGRSYEQNRIHLGEFINGAKIVHLTFFFRCQIPLEHRRWDDGIFHTLYIPPYIPFIHTGKGASFQTFGIVVGTAHNVRSWTAYSYADGQWNPSIWVGRPLSSFIFEFVKLSKAPYKMCRYGLQLTFRTVDCYIVFAAPGPHETDGGGTNVRKQANHALCQTPLPRPLIHAL